MADLTITAASVLAGAGATTKDGTFGATIAQGKVVVQDTTTGKFILGDNNSATAAVRGAKGIALNAGSDGQPGKVLTEGPITIGATLVAGASYFLSDTPGGICPDTDVGAGEEAILIGVALSTTVLDVQVSDSGVTR